MLNSERLVSDVITHLVSLGDVGCQSLHLAVEDVVLLHLVLNAG